MCYGVEWNVHERRWSQKQFIKWIWLCKRTCINGHSIQITSDTLQLLTGGMNQSVRPKKFEYNNFPIDIEKNKIYFIDLPYPNWQQTLSIFSFFVSFQMHLFAEKTKFNLLSFGERKNIYGFLFGACCPHKKLNGSIIFSGYFCPFFYQQSAPRTTTNIAGYQSQTSFVPPRASCFCCLDFVHFFVLPDFYGKKVYHFNSIL